MQSLARAFLQDGESAPLFAGDCVDFSAMNHALMSRIDPSR
jgi:hypothetical protein